MSSHHPEQLGNAEVDELRIAVLAHQNIAWLEVAVQHQVRVRVLHRASRTRTNTSTLCRVSSLRASHQPVIDRPRISSIARYGEPSERLSDIEHACDGRMLEPGNDLAFPQEAFAPARIERSV